MATQNAPHTDSQTPLKHAGEAGEHLLRVRRVPRDHEQAAQPADLQEEGHRGAAPHRPPRRALHSEALRRQTKGSKNEAKLVQKSF